MLLGISPTLRTTEPTAGLLDAGYTDAGKSWIYVQANGAISQYDFVVVDETGQAAALSTSNDARGDLVAVAAAAFADNEYGWVQIRGVATVNVLASCAANARINTTATAGSLDDDGTAGAFEVSGVVLTTARGGSNGSAPAILNFPAIGPVLS